MTINHASCDHESSSSARAKCRRAIAGGAKKAPSKVIDLRDGTPTGRPRTPSDPAKCCDICGVERIILKGTDPLRGILIFVGEKCAYMVKNSADREYLPD